MRLSPIRPDLELSGRRAPHPEMTPRKLDGFHKEFAEGEGFLCHSIVPKVWLGIASCEARFHRIHEI